MTSLCTEWTGKRLALHYLGFDETGPAGMLLEAFAHHEGVRRPLGAAARDVPAERVTLVAEMAVRSVGATGAKKRARGPWFEATDIDWSAR